VNENQESIALAQFLALDWDNREFHLVAANIGRGKVQIQRAISWREEEPVLPANAEQFGQRLRDQMKNAGIAPAPLIVGLGRDRVVVKEVRYPQVPADVEVAIVRNQIVKDLIEAADDVYLDYAPLAEPSRAGERRALALVVRKDMIQALQTVARAAGLKLLAVTARPFGIAACYKDLAGATPQVPAPPSPDAVAGILTVATGWAEFCAVRGRQLLFARSIGVGDGMLGEIRRNLAAYAGQPQLSFPRDAIQALYVCGDGENAVLREKLKETLGIPVHGLDPFAKEDRVEVAAANRAGFTGAVGLLHLWASDGTTPVNFVKPREAKQAANPNKRRAIVFGTAAAVAVALLIFAGMQFVGAKEQELAEMRSQKIDLDKRLKDFKPDIDFMEACTEFTDGAVPLLDELYDLAARAPHEKGFRIKQMTVTPISTKSAKGRLYTLKVDLFGVVDGSKKSLVQQLMNTINQDKHCTCKNTWLKDDKVKGSTSVVEYFKLEVLVAHQPALQYTTRLVPPQVSAGSAKRTDDDDDQ
jgi:Tfp pilus assembly PilM family ATPase